MVFGVSVNADDQKEHYYIPPAGFVPDEQTAIKIAHAILTPIYGRDVLEKEEPFVAHLSNNVWTVTGSIPKDRLGGVALIEISKIDARILRVTHGK